MLVPVALVLVSKVGELSSEHLFKMLHKAIALRVKQHSPSLANAQLVTDLSHDCSLEVAPLGVVGAHLAL